jgi:mannose-6-phosphate isomerase-like protein (cupin superfamily)
MPPSAINLRGKLEQFTEQWSPRICAQMNDAHFKLVKFQGEFVWHLHEDTDEVFLVLAGGMSIEFRDGVVELKEGEMIVVPRLVEHKPVAASECHVLLVERAGTVNRGDADEGPPATTGEWI